MGKPTIIKVLAVDVAKEYRDLYEGLLTDPQLAKGQYKVRTVDSGIKALEEFDSFKPDILMLDTNLDGVSGLELCKTIRRRKDLSSYVGIVFVTSNTSPKLVAEALELGADDFCSKDHTATELVARINAVSRIKQMTDSLRTANDKLKAYNDHLAKVSITDDLTKLYNMKFFKKRLSEEFTRAKRYKKHLSLLMFDLDHFKKVNDTVDHLMGSYVLSEIGKIVSASVRSVDIAARFGGDEYIILLPETDEEGSANLAKRILKKIEHHLFRNNNQEVKITASMGVATLEPGSSYIQSGVDLIRTADQYLYLAKTEGRNKYIDAKIFKKLEKKP